MAPDAQAPLWTAGAALQKGWGLLALELGVMKGQQGSRLGNPQACLRGSVAGGVDGQLSTISCVGGRFI